MLEFFFGSPDSIPHRCALFEEPVGVRVADRIRMKTRIGAGLQQLIGDATREHHRRAHRTGAFADASHAELLELTHRGATGHADAFRSRAAF